MCERAALAYYRHELPDRVPGLPLFADARARSRAVPRVAVEILRQTIKALVPGSALFLAAGCAVGVLLLFRGPRATRVARWGLTGLLAFYLLLSLQGTSDFLVG